MYQPEYQARRGHICALVALLAVVSVGIMGCSGNKTTFVPTPQDPSTVAATFVGNDTTTCGSCHSDIAAEYTGSGGEAPNKHGQDFHTAHAPSDLITTVGCQPCHSVGYGLPTGFVSLTATPQLTQIGCQDCHGAGSKHVANPSTTNITRVPKAEDSCWRCHGPSLDVMKTNPGATTDTNIYATIPKKVGGPHHPQTPMINGVLGYGSAPGPGAHGLIDNTCVHCHMQPHLVNGQMDHGEAMPTVDIPDACTSCHTDPAGLKATFQASIKAKLIQIGGADSSGNVDATAAGGLLKTFATAHSIDVATNANPSDPNVQIYKGARWNWGLVNGDKSLGVHNPTYAENLLNDAIAKLSQ